MMKNLTISLRLSLKTQLFIIICLKCCAAMLNDDWLNVSSAFSGRLDCATAANKSGGRGGTIR